MPPWTGWKEYDVRHDLESAKEPSIAPNKPYYHTTQYRSPDSNGGLIDTWALAGIRLEPVSATEWHTLCGSPL